MLPGKFYRRIVVLLLLLGGTDAICQSRATDSLLLLVKNHPKDTALVSLLVELGKTYRNKSRFAEANTTLNQSIDLSRTLDFREGEANGFCQLGNVQLYSQEYEAAKKNYFIGLAMSRAIEDKKGICASLYGLCFAELKLNHFDSAEVYSLQTIDYANELHDSALLVKAVNIEASVFYRHGEYHKAIEWYLRQLKIAESIHDSINVASAYGNIGSIYSALKNFQEAIKFQKIALEKKLHNRQIKEMATTYSNIGNYYSDIRERDSALYYYRLGLSVSIPNNLRQLSCNIYDDMTTIFDSHEDYDSAFFYNQKALSANQELKDTLEVASNLAFKGQIYAHRASKNHSATDYSKAIDNIQESLILFTKMNSKNWIRQVYKKLADIYSEKHELDKAYYYLQKYTALNDSMRDTTFTLQIAEMTTKYESEKKDKAITENKLQIQKQSLVLEKKSNDNKMLLAGVAGLMLLIVFGSVSLKQRQKLHLRKKEIENQKALEDTRAAIARDLHDDIGATLSSVQIMSSFASTAMERSADDAKVWVNKISDSTGDILQNIRDIVWTMNPENDKAEELILRMRYFASQLLEPKEIKYSFDSGESVVSYLNTLPAKRNVFLIYKEALNNAAKYSECSEMKITLNMIALKCEMKISDNGKGFDAQARNAGNGMANMTKRANELNGSLQVESSITLGSRITLIC